MVGVTRVPEYFVSVSLRACDSLLDCKSLCKRKPLLCSSRRCGHGCTCSTFAFVAQEISTHGPLLFMVMLFRCQRSGHGRNFRLGSAVGFSM